MRFSLLQIALLGIALGLVALAPSRGMTINLQALEAVLGQQSDE
jgi:hypothetical protein